MGFLRSVRSAQGGQTELLVCQFGMSGTELELQRALHFPESGYKIMNPEAEPRTKDCSSKKVSVQFQVPGYIITALANERELGIALDLYFAPSLEVYPCPLFGLGSHGRMWATSAELQYECNPQYPCPLVGETNPAVRITSRNARRSVLGDVTFDDISADFCYRSPFRPPAELMLMWDPGDQGTWESIVESVNIPHWRVNAVNLAVPRPEDRIRSAYGFELRSTDKVPEGFQRVNLRFFLFVGLLVGLVVCTKWLTCSNSQPHVWLKVSGGMGARSRLWSFILDVAHLAFGEYSASAGALSTKSDLRDD